MSDESNDKRYWRGVFRRTMARYDEIKSVHSTNSCAVIYNGLEGAARGGTKIVTVLPSDFLCDVELAARRALTEGEHAFFTGAYLAKDIDFMAEMVKGLGADKYTSLMHRVQEEIGKELVASHIHPIEQYMQPVDLR